MLRTLQQREQQQQQQQEELEREYKQQREEFDKRKQTFQRLQQQFEEHQQCFNIQRRDFEEEQKAFQEKQKNFLQQREEFSQQWQDFQCHQKQYLHDQSVFEEQFQLNSSQSQANVDLYKVFQGKQRQYSRHQQQYEQQQLHYQQAQQDFDSHQSEFETVHRRFEEQQSVFNLQQQHFRNFLLQYRELQERFVQYQNIRLEAENLQNRRNELASEEEHLLQRRAELREERLRSEQQQLRQLISLLEFELASWQHLREELEGDEEDDGGLEEIREFEQVLRECNSAIESVVSSGITLVGNANDVCRSCAQNILTWVRAVSSGFVLINEVSTTIRDTVLPTIQLISSWPTVSVHPRPPLASVVARLVPIQQLAEDESCQETEQPGTSFYYSHPKHGRLRLCWQDPLPLQIGGYRCDICNQDYIKSAYRAVSAIDGSDIDHSKFIVDRCGWDICASCSFSWYRDNCISLPEKLVSDSLHENAPVIAVHNHGESKNSTNICFASEPPLFNYDKEIGEAKTSVKVSMCGESLLALLIPAEELSASKWNWRFAFQSDLKLSKYSTMKCTICLDPLSENALGRLRPVVTRCNHWFHLSCLRTHIRGKSCCPICRTEDPLCNDSDSDQTQIISLPSYVLFTRDSSGRPLSYKNKYSCICVVCADISRPLESWRYLSHCIKISHGSSVV